MWCLISIHLQAWNLGEPLSEFPPSSRNFHSRSQKNKVHDQSGHETLTIHLQQSLQKRTQGQLRLQRVLMVGSSLVNSTLRSRYAFYAHLTHLHHHSSLLPLLSLNSGGTRQGDSNMLPQFSSNLFLQKQVQVSLLPYHVPMQSLSQAANCPSRLEICADKFLSKGDTSSDPNFPFAPSWPKSWVIVPLPCFKQCPLWYPIWVSKRPELRHTATLDNNAVVLHNE